MSGSVFQPSSYWNFVQKVVDTQVWKPMQDKLDSRLNTIVQRTEETQKRIETTTLSDVLARLFNGDSQSASFSSSSTGSLSTDPSSLESHDTDTDSSNSTSNFTGDKDSGSTSSTDTADSTITVLTENDIVPSPTGPDKRYQQEKPLRSWKKIHAVYLNRRRRRLCHVRRGSETSSTSSVEWCSLQESMEKQGLLRGPFVMDFVKPQYENAYIRSKREPEEAAPEPMSKAKRKLDLSNLIAEYDRQNTSFLIKIPTDMTPKIPKAQVNYCEKHKRSKSTSELPEKNTLTNDQHLSTDKKVRIPGKDPCSVRKVHFEKFIEAEPFVPTHVREHKIQQSETTENDDNIGEMTDRNAIINKWLENGVCAEQRQNDECYQELEENVQPRTKLTAMAKEFIPRRNVTTANATSHVPDDDKCAEVVPSTLPDCNHQTETRQEPRLSEIFDNASRADNTELAGEPIQTDKDNFQGTVGPVQTHQTYGVNHSQPAPGVDNVNDSNKKCGTLGQTVTDHTQPLPRIGLLPPPGIPHPNMNPQQNIPTAACNGGQMNGSMHYPSFPQSEHNRMRPPLNGVLDDPITGQHRQPLQHQYPAHMDANNPHTFYQRSQAHVQQGYPLYGSMQAHHQQQPHQQQMANQQQHEQQQHFQQQLQQQIGNMPRMQDPNILYAQQGQQLMYQMMAEGVPQVQAQRNVEHMAARAQFEYQEQLARNMAATAQPQRAAQQNAVPRQAPTMMERFRSPSMVPEFIPSNK